MTPNFVFILFKRDFKMLKIALLVADLFKIVICANWITCEVTTAIQSGAKITKKLNISHDFFCIELKLSTVVIHSSQSSMIFPLWHFHGNIMGSRPSPYKEENQSFPPSRSIICSCCSFSGVSEYGHYTAQAQESLFNSGATNRAVFILGR